MSNDDREVESRVDDSTEHAVTKEQQESLPSLASIFKPERLSNVRDRTYLTYRLNAVRDTFVAERTPDRKWLAVSPSTLG